MVVLVVAPQVLVLVLMERIQLLGQVYRRVKASGHFLPQMRTLMVGRVVQLLWVQFPV